MIQLRLSEIFFSIQGESTSQGWPTVFIRLTGCPLRCTYCDSAYAFSGGQLWEISSIIEHIAQYPTQHITVTGGEPLAQPACLALLHSLCECGYQVSLETSGALTIAAVDARVRKIVDFKTPSSGEVGRNLWDNVAHLQAHDEIKFVVGDRQDFDWMLLQLDVQELIDKAAVIWVSPVYQQLHPKELAQWVLQAGIQVRLQVQLHKLLWGDLPGH